VGTSVTEGDKGPKDAPGLGQVGTGGVEPEKRFAGGVTADFHAEPRECLADSGPQCLGGGFLGGKPRGQMGGGAGLGLGLSHLPGMENPLQKTVPEFFYRVLHAVDFDKIHAQPEKSFCTHRSEIASRKSRTLRSSPTIRAWLTKE
jgi:hypothetical protein